DLAPETEAEHDQPGNGGSNDHNVDRTASLLLPVDVFEVEPQRELVQGQGGADTEEDRHSCATDAVLQRVRQVAGDQHQQDPGYQVVQVRLADLDVAERSPSLVDQVRDSPDDRESYEERDEDPERLFLVLVDDVVAIAGADVVPEVVHVPPT